MLSSVSGPVSAVLTESLGAEQLVSDLVTRTGVSSWPQGWGSVRKGSPWPCLSAPPGRVRFTCGKTRE